MPKAKLKVSSGYDASETYTKLKKLFKSSSEIKKIDPDISFEFDDARLRGIALGRRFRAELKVKEANPQAKVHVVLELPLLLAPFLGQVEREVKKKLVSAVGAKKAKQKS